MGRARAAGAGAGACRRRRRRPTCGRSRPSARTPGTPARSSPRRRAWRIPATTARPRSHAGRGRRRRPRRRRSGARRTGAWRARCLRAAPRPRARQRLGAGTPGPRSSGDLWPRRNHAAQIGATALPGIPRSDHRWWWAGSGRYPRFVRLSPALAAEAAAARAVAGLSRLAGAGGGTTLPGKLLWKLDPGAIDRLAARLPAGAYAVSATNGKTTTTAMAAEILRPRYRLA